MGLTANFRKSASINGVRARLHLQQPPAGRVQSDRCMATSRPGGAFGVARFVAGMLAGPRGTLLTPFAPVHLLLWLFVTVHRTDKAVAMLQHCGPNTPHCRIHGVPHMAW